MSISAAPAGVDLLTRTILTIEGSTTTTSSAHLIQALQRVPGVLFAEVDSASGRASVAHDAAVPTASLLAAATGVGVQAGLVASSSALPVDTNAEAQLQGALLRRRMFIWAAVFAAVTLIEGLIPNSPEKHWLLPVLISAFWLSFLIFRVLGARRA